MNMISKPADTISQQPILQVRDLVKHFRIGGGFGRKHVVRSLEGVSLDVRPGETFGIVGESGCGKSTLARAILGLVRIDGGAVQIEGQDVSRLSGRSLKAFRRSAQLVFQDPHGALDPLMTVEQSLMAPLNQHGIGNWSDRKAAVSAMLAEVGLDDSFLGRRPCECSGGQLQRVVIARALLLRPRILICDEPTSALDASIRAQILNLLADLKHRFGLTLIMISHDLRVVRYICDRVAVMYLGRIVEQGPRDVVFGAPSHPYTQALMGASMLHAQSVGVKPKALEGEAPSPIAPPPGCPFHPRCARREPICERERPELAPILDGRLVACRFPLFDALERSPLAAQDSA